MTTYIKQPVPVQNIEINITITKDDAKHMTDILTSPPPNGADKITREEVPPV